MFLLVAGAMLAIPLSLGYLGLSWDALNHHVYLGWTAEHNRFDRDYLAASHQAYTYPYLYWPLYKLALSGADGTTAGVVLALLHSTAIPPVWLLARYCIPGHDLFARGIRLAAVLTAFLSPVVLSLFDSTSNDLLAGVPLLWAIAIAVRPIAMRPWNAFSATAWSGLLAGIAIAFKLSNAPLALALPILWLWPPGTAADRTWRLVVAAACIFAGWLLFYGYWGWQLWTHYGSPIYPLYDHWFEPVRDALGWHR